MSTDNLSIPDNLEKELARLGVDALDRSKKIGDEIDGQKKHQHNVALGASVIIQKSVDKVAELDEEASQMEDIRTRAEALLSRPSPVPTSPEAPAPVVNVPNTPVNPPTQALPAADQVSSEPENDANNLDGAVWLLAMIVALIAVLLGWQYRHFADDLPVVIEQIVKAAFLSGCALAGYKLVRFVANFFNNSSE